MRTWRMEKQGPRILLVDDEKPVRQVLGVALGPAGYTMYQVGNGGEALRRFQLIRPDLVLLDLDLPDIDGKEVIRRLRERTFTPIIVISVRHAESEKICSLDTGADDYVTKPFGMGELLARIRVALRGVSTTQSDIFSSGDLKVDFGRRAVLIRNTRIKLTATEYDLLKILIHHAGRVRTHYQLIHELWGATQYQDAVHLLRVTLSHLRRKLQIDPIGIRHIVTEPGVGYRLRTEQSDWEDLFDRKTASSGLLERDYPTLR
jgi:two-component system, OmpR family, KDP operon response regulator KdpE